MQCCTCGLFTDVEMHKCDPDRALAWSGKILQSASEYSYVPTGYGMEQDKKDTNPKDKAASTRLDFSVWPTSASAYGALAMTEGDYKYGAYNYRIAGVQASIYISALNRHVAKWYNGEDNDPKTGVPHLANAIACLGVLIDAIVSKKLVDDRPPAQDMGRLLADMELKVQKLQEVFPPAQGPGRYTEIKHGETSKLV